MDPLSLTASYMGLISFCSTLIKAFKSLSLDSDELARLQPIIQQFEAFSHILMSTTENLPKADVIPGSDIYLSICYDSLFRINQSMKKILTGNKTLRTIRVKQFIDQNHKDIDDLKISVLLLQNLVQQNSIRQLTSMVEHFGNLMVHFNEKSMKANPDFSQELHRTPEEGKSLRGGENTDSIHQPRRSSTQELNADQDALNGKYHVLVSARNTYSAQAAVEEIQKGAIGKADLTAITLDVTDDVSIEAAAKGVSDQFGHLDILINNAGVGQAPGASSVREQFRQIFEVNVFGVAAVTDAFLPLLRASSFSDRRIVNVTTGLGLITMAGKKDYAFNANAWYVPDYRSSKAALNMITAAQSVKFASDKIAVIAVAPGMCRTKFTGGQGRKEASDGAKVIVRAATEGNPEELSGTYVADEPHDGW
ncbi:hypothetical protein F4806DRAFT_501811 [Annulohypoxylon nitens]|nr:hypothetical protein F4806DRAFT_501811 [Annulohypoxylon nitens]